MGVQILYAGVGAGNITDDVKTHVQNMCDQGQNTITGQDLDRDFGDPAPGKNKAFFVIWKNGNNTKQATLPGGSSEKIVIS